MIDLASICDVMYLGLKKQAYTFTDVDNIYIYTHSYMILCIILYTICYNIYTLYIYKLSYKYQLIRLCFFGTCPRTRRWQSSSGYNQKALPRYQKFCARPEFHRIGQTWVGNGTRHELILAIHGEDSINKGFDSGTHTHHHPVELHLFFGSFSVTGGSYTSPVTSNFHQLSEADHFCIYYSKTLCFWGSPIF